MLMLNTKSFITNMQLRIEK